MSDPIDLIVRDLARRDPLPPGEPGDEAWARATLAAILAEPRPERRRPSRRRRVLRALPVAGLVAGLAGAAALLLVAAPDGTEPQPPRPAASPTGIAALDRPARAGDALPAWVRADPVVTGANVIPGSSRLLDRDDARLLYAARAERTAATGARTDAVCLLDVVARTPGKGFRPGRPGRLLCVPEARFEDGGFLLMTVVSSQEGGPVGLIGLVPDGFTTARNGPREAPIVGNVVRIRAAAPWRAVQIDGAAGRRVDWTGHPAPGPRPGTGRELPVALFRTPPVPVERLPARIRRAVADEPGRRAWRVVAAGQTYWLLTDGRPGARVLTIGDAIGGGGIPTAGYPLNWGLASRGTLDGPVRYRFSALVADGYTRLTGGGRSAEVRGNFVVLTGTAWREPLTLTLTGPAGRFSLTLPTGGQPTQLLEPVGP